MRAKELFAQCHIAFVSSFELTPKRVAELSEVIKNNGGKICEPRDDGQIPMAEATHIVANTIDFAQYTEAQAMMVPVVVDTWIQLSLNKSRLAQIRPFSPDPRMIFSSVVITCAGLPTMDKESIIGATAALGGTDSPDVTRLTTHICALSDDHPMCVEAKAKGFRAKIVLPHWFDDCFKLGKRIDESPYLLPNPEILRVDPFTSIQMPSSQHLEGATSAQPEAKSNLSSSRVPLNVFKLKKVMLAEDLALSTRLREILDEIITNSGGEITDDVEECHMYICQYRDGADYVRAAKLIKDVGNLSWLYHIITTDQWTDPLHRLLHYPIPRNGIPGFEDYKITLSNYGGEARSYLENLIKAAGGTFTKTMKAENTHLITARNNSEKCEAAADWGINMVNHLWIEESYARCQVQPCSNPKYSHFPSRTNLGEVIGQVFLDETRLREEYYPYEEGDEDLPPSAKRRRLILQAAQDNAQGKGPAEGVAIGRDDVKVWREEMRSSRRKKAQAQPETQPETPAPRKQKAKPRDAAGKENDLPGSSFSSGTNDIGSVGRSAKNKAAATLRLLATDMEQYDKEKKRHSKDGKGIWGGKRAADQLDSAVPAQKAGKSGKAKGGADDEEEEDDDDDEDAETTTRPSKKRKKMEKPYRITVTITSYSRWLDDPRKEDKDRMKLSELGIRIVPENSACQYLVAPRILRTLKFICGLIRGATIISTDFLDHVLESKPSDAAADPRDYILQDREGEKAAGIKLTTSVARARANGGKLLRGVPVYCTPHVKHGVKTYETIARACHAIWKTYDGRHVTIKKMTAEEDGGLPPDPVYLLSSNTGPEMELHAKFAKMAREGNMEPRIVAPDWLLDVCMKQEVLFDPKYAAKNALED